MIDEVEMETKRVAGREGAQPDSGVYLASVRPLQRPFSSHRFAAALDPHQSRVWTLKMMRARPFIQLTILPGLKP